MTTINLHNRVGYKPIESYPQLSKRPGSQPADFPVAVGQRVINQDGIIGIVADVTSYSRSGAGEWLSYTIVVRFDWTSPLYGLEFRAGKGELSIVDENGIPVRDI